MKIDALASFPHYADHIAPVWEQLPEDMRGTFYSATRRSDAQPIPSRWSNEQTVVLVAGWLDATRAQGRPVIFLEHGAGQHYPDDAASAKHGSYSGGQGLDCVKLFLCPSERVAQRWRQAYPQTPAVVIGCPRLDGLRRKRQRRPVVAVTFHWDLIPEGQSYSGPVPVGASVRRYEGPIVDVVVAGSHERLSVSPDHPVLTTRGWVRGAELMQGDQLIRCSIAERDVCLTANDYLPPSRVENVAGALLKSLEVFPGVVPAASPHLDHERCQKQIDIVRADGFLRDNIAHAAIHKKIDHPGFERALLSQVGFTSGRTLTQFVEARDRVTTRSMMRAASQNDPAICESAIDGRLADPEMFRQFVSACPSGVSLHEIRSLSVRKFRGHGYDFTTVPRWYEINGFVVHNCPLVPETRWALPHFDRALPQLVEIARERDWELLGHAHPRARRRLDARWRELGVRYEPSSDDVLRRSSVVVADNTSLMWEAAALDIPLVVLDAPWYRRDVEHGLRFWEHADAGVRVDDPTQLADSIEIALRDEDPDRRARRRSAASAVYDRCDSSAARRAVAAILALLGGDMSLAHTHVGPHDAQIQTELDHFLMRLGMLGASEDELTTVRQHWNERDEEWTDEYRRQLISSSDAHLRALIEDIRDEYPFEPEHPKPEEIEQNASGVAMGIWEDGDGVPDFAQMGVRPIMRWVQNDRQRANVARTWELENAQRLGRDVRKSLIDRLDMVLRGSGG